MNKTSPSSRTLGFTLMELLVVMGIIAILMSLIVGVFSKTAQSGTESQAKAQIADLMNEIEKFRADEGRYPNNWSDFDVWYNDRYSDTVWAITDSGSAANPMDPWGQTYVYEHDAGESSFVYLIGTTGIDMQDGIEGNRVFGEGDDITNRNGELQ